MQEQVRESSCSFIQPDIEEICGNFHRGAVETNLDKQALLVGKLSVESTFGVPIVAQWITNPTRNHEVAGSGPALAQWVNDQALP